MNVPHTMLHEFTTGAPAGGGGSAATAPASSTPATNYNPFESSPSPHVGGNSTEAQIAAAQQQAEREASGGTTTQPVVQPTPAPTPAPVTAYPPAPANTPPSAAALTEQQIAKIAADSTAAVLARQPVAPTQVQQPAAPTLTREQWNQKFNVVDLTAKQFQDITGYAPDKPEQVAALNGVLQGTAKQSVTMAAHLFAEDIAKLRAEFSGQLQPITSAFQVQQGKAIEEQFFAANPDLKDYHSLVMEIGRSAVQQGMKFASLADANKFVAEKVRGFIPKGSVATQQGNPPVQQQQPQSLQPATRTMTPLSGGGQQTGANGSATAPTTSESLARSIFG